MIELLKELGVPAISIILLVLVLAVLRELFLFVKGLRQKGAELVLEKELKELDARIEDFYMPLRERFQLSRLVNESSSNWQHEGRFDNAAVNIESDNDQALRNILVRRVFLPINDEIKSIILNKLHWKHPDDPTNYEDIVQHFVLWQAFESAKAEGEIADYEASHMLTFPSEEVEKQKDMCEKLFSEREQMRQELKQFRSTKSKRRCS